MLLAGIRVRDQDVLELARLLRDRFWTRSRSPRSEPCPRPSYPPSPPAARPDRPARDRARRGRHPGSAVALPAPDARARFDGHDDLGVVLVELGRHRRARRPLARSPRCLEDGDAALDRPDPIDPDIHAAVCALTPREDRDIEGQVLVDLEDTRLHTAITRACKAAGTPHWSPHDLRHRRISLLVLRSTPIPRVSAYVGHARGSMTLDVYSHVLLEASELDYAALIA
jgi:Phage integrase family